MKTQALDKNIYINTWDQITLDHELKSRIKDTWRDCKSCTASAEVEF